MSAENPNQPCNQFPEQFGTTIEIVCQESLSPMLSALCWPFLDSVPFGLPIVDIHMVKSRLGAEVARHPESDARICFWYAPPHFPRNQRVSAG